MIPLENAPKRQEDAAVKVLIEAGYIKNFEHIFDFIPISVVSRDSGSNYVRFIRYIDNPSRFKLKDLFILAKLFEVEEMKLIALVYIQLKPNA